MDSTKKTLLIGGAAIAGVLFMLYRHNKAGDNISIGDTNTNISTGSPPGFLNEITVKADPNLLADLNQKYMPLFGFVGMTTTGQMPVAISINQQFINEQSGGLRPPVVVAQQPIIAARAPAISDFQRRVNDARRINYNWRTGA